MAEHFEEGDIVEHRDYGRGVVMKRTPHTHRNYTRVNFYRRNPPETRRVRTMMLVKVEPLMRDYAAKAKMRHPSYVDDPSKDTLTLELIDKGPDSC